MRTREQRCVTLDERIGGIAHVLCCSTSQGKTDWDVLKGMLGSFTHKYTKLLSRGQATVVNTYICG